jgi:hypothetical protein
LSFLVLLIFPVTEIRNRRDKGETTHVPMFVLQTDCASKSKSQESALLRRQAMPTSQKKQVATKQAADGF